MTQRGSLTGVQLAGHVGSWWTEMGSGSHWRGLWGIIDYCHPSESPQGAAQAAEESQGS
jgi:hypothetical protein